MPTVAASKKELLVTKLKSIDSTVCGVSVESHEMGQWRYTNPVSHNRGHRDVQQGQRNRGRYANSRLVAANMSRLTSPDAPHLENLNAPLADLDRCPLDTTQHPVGFTLPPSARSTCSPPSCPPRSSSVWTFPPSPPSAALTNAQEGLSTPSTNTATSSPKPRPSSAPPSPAAQQIG